ncbi:hypothetical protein CapIbe_016001 [Capra ibex]
MHTCFPHSWEEIKLQRILGCSCLLPWPITSISLLGRTLAELMKPVGPLGLPVEEFMDSLASLPRSLEMYRSRETGTSSWPDMLKEFCARHESYSDSIGERIWRSGRSEDQAFGTEESYGPFYFILGSTVINHWSWIDTRRGPPACHFCLPCQGG